MDLRQIVTAAVVSVLAAALGFFATRSSGSLPDHGDEDSLRTARGVLRRAGVAVATSAIVCLFAGLVGVASGREFAPVQTLIVGLVPQVALCAAVLRPIPASGAVGGVLAPRRLRDLVPWPLLVATAILLVPGTLSALAMIYLGAQPLGTPESNRLGFGCAAPAVPGPSEPYSDPLRLGGSWWPRVQLGLMWLSVAVAMVAVRHCYRRSSAVSDATVDSALRRCLATRSCAAAAVVIVLVAGYATSRLSDVATRVPNASRWSAEFVSGPAGGVWPRRVECVLSDEVLAIWDAVGKTVGWTMPASLLVAVWAIAYYLMPSRLIRKAPRPAEGVRVS